MELHIINYVLLITIFLKINNQLRLTKSIIMETKKMNFKEMEKIEGGLNATQFMAITCGVATIGSAFGPVGLAIFGPTALGCAVFGVIDAFGTVKTSNIGDTKKLNTGITGSVLKIQ